MRVGYVLQDPARRPTGLDVYTTNLWRALVERDDEIELVAVTLPAGWASRALLRLLWEQVFLPLWALAKRIDVLHVPAGSLPVAWRGASVMTLHDLGEPADASYRSALGPRLFFGHIVPFTARRATAILADSEATKRDAISRLAIPASRITVAPLAASPSFRRPSAGEIAGVLERYGIERPYFLQVGAPVERKNVAGALRGFARLSARHPDLGVDFVHAGGDESLPDVPAEARPLVEQGRVRALGHVTEGDLAALYGGALAAVLSSFYEGFGLPLVESFACGTPAIASRVASLPEVGGDAALYIDPDDPDTIAEAMAAYATSPELRARMARRAKARSASFSWRVTADRTVEAYHAAAVQRRPSSTAPKVLFVRVDSLGDLVLTTPCFEAVKRRYPDARVDVLVRPATAPLLEGSRHVDRVFTLDPPWRGHARPEAVVEALRMIRRLRRERYDYVVVPRRDLDDALFARACGGKETVGFRASRTRWFLSRSVAFDARRHTVDNHLRLMSLLDCDAADLRPAVECTAGFEPARDGDRPLIAVAPFASSEVKTLEPTVVAELCDRLASDLGADLILLGGPADRDRAEAIASRTSAPLRNAAGGTSIGELCDLLRGCDAAVCVDSAPMHLAAALGTPVVALFGGEDPTLWGPYGDGHRVLRTAGGDGQGPASNAEVVAAVGAVLDERACPLNRERIAA